MVTITVVDLMNRGCECSLAPIGLAYSRVEIKEVVVARPRKQRPMVEASQLEASLAVRLYNDTTEPQSFEGFVVHMHQAWLYLLHAEAGRDRKDIRYRQTDNPRRLLRVDGEVLQWDLDRCVEDRWEEQDAVRLNLELFTRLRNMIEHRPAGVRSDALAVVLSGHAQAMLLNYEEELVFQFTEAASLATRLRFPVFIGSFTDQGETALHRLRDGLPVPLRTFIAEYEAGLPSGVATDRRFELRLRVMNEHAPKDPDALALQFTRYDGLTQEQKIVVQALGRNGTAVVREQARAVVNLELRRPREVVRQVGDQIPFRFHMGHFVRAWQTLGVRPPGGVDRPERTDEKYSVYDARHNDYGYTVAYVEKLVRELKTAKGFKKLLGETPRDKETGLRA